MKLTVVGCWGAYPEQGAATSCYLVEKDGFTCVIDFGSGALSRIQAFKQILHINAVVLSHYHQDHIADIGVLQYSLLVQHSIHQTEGMLPIYGHELNREAFAKLSHQHTRGVAYNPNEALKVGPFSFTFLKTVHPVPCYAMRISDGDTSIVYTADSSFQESFIPFCEGADLLVAEASFYEGQDGSNAGHMTSKDCADIAQQAGVKQLLLTHLPHFGDHQQLVKQAKHYYSGDVLLAVEGFVWNC
ncbi:MBL fold metallo-hydrolase [Aquibacillus salsiterrae]|uniref:MBL fold metallo-hydrolase n=1 Tax=Aquibacillus salsiterrae TaxID=2950439 RepID=A0A9X4AGG2_9BACI|nr:MBL fold metallo-hydrolase [Aquibacillus salsiterrae]MDC3417250.1 MBL fold metallo-hydrolase [Aquibacillus salsiterrae]